VSLSSNNALKKLGEYFDGIANSIEEIRNSSKVFSNSGDIGIAREDAFMDLFANHIPTRCEAVKGGFVFNDSGKISKQIDILITNEHTIRFNHFRKNQHYGKSFNVSEGCLGAFSVKSNLNKKELIDSLDNLHSIPKQTNLLADDEYTKEALAEYPLKGILAYDGMEGEKILKYTNEYYDKKSIPKNQKVHLILVNNKTLIRKIKRGGQRNRNPKKISKEHTLRISDLHDRGGYGIFYLLGHVQNYANLGSKIFFNFNEYHNKLIDGYYKTG